MEKIINILLNEAKKAFEKGEIPVGAVITLNDRVISYAHNQKQKSHFVINHAEIIAIKKASKKLRDWRLDDCELYVTLEPCKMCKEVIRQVRIKKVYYLLSSEFDNENNKIITYKEILNNKSDEYKQLLQSFFKNKR